MKEEGGVGNDEGSQVMDDDNDHDDDQEKQLKEGEKADPSESESDWEEHAGRRKRGRAKAKPKAKAKGKAKPKAKARVDDKEENSKEGIRDQSKNKKFNEIFKMLPGELQQYCNACSRSEKTAFVHAGIERSGGKLSLNQNALFQLMASREEAQRGKEMMTGLIIEDHAQTTSITTTTHPKKREMGAQLLS